MVVFFAQQSVEKLVQENINRAHLFEQFGIDYCDGGEKSLGQACHEAGLSVDEVCHALDEIDKQPRTDHPDCSMMTLAQLIDHIVETHHTYLRRELPRLDNLMARVAAAHGLKYCHLHDLASVYVRLESELQSHMLKEEQVLFPIVKQLEHADAEHVPSLHVAIIDNPISVLKDEHRLASELLRRLRQLSDDYTAPPDTCRTYQALVAGLKQLEQDLHVHIHKENNVLFPRAAELESLASMESS